MVIIPVSRRLLAVGQSRGGFSTQPELADRRGLRKYVRGMDPFK